MNGPFDAIVVERTDVEELIDAAQAAIDGDSNDAEHDALVSILHYLISIAALGPLDFDEKGSPDIPKVVKIAYAIDRKSVV